MNETKTFADLGVDEAICDALADIDIATPFPIQELTLPVALNRADIIGQARTGTGKTLAFGIPLLEHVDPEAEQTEALVVVPTRELCLQVRDDLAQAGSRLGIRVVAVYGGKAIDAQADAIAKGAPIVVGTPGRLLDMRRRGLLDLSEVTNLVLDEADEMLDLGFLPDVEKLIEACARDRHTQLFSATMPSAVVGLARRYMRKPTFLRADVEEQRIAPETTQYFFSCHRMDKPAVLARILQSPGHGLTLAFTRTKRMADVLAKDLRDRGINAAPIHSDLRQEAREKTLRRFRDGKVDVLCATEVAARGLDIDDVTHVVNYDCPDDEKMYLHRIGRTGRAGAAGVAITFALWSELARLEMIKRALDIDAPTHEVFSTSPILTELFDLPERKGRAPRHLEPEEVSGERRASRTPRSKRSAKPAAGPRAKRTADDGPARTRVRQRTKSRPSDTAEPAAAEAGKGPARRRVRERTRSRTGATGRRGADHPTPRQAGGRAERAAVTEPAEARRDRSPGKDRERQPRAKDRERPAARGERRRESSAQRRASGASEPRSSEDARGDGQPRLHRPLEITHLP